ncbi:MAG: hypothetical protein SOZ62_03335 [Eubacteriales bacterium]|nr:hypothetical protein [Eubacteriales bacterium]
MEKTFFPVLSIKICERYCEMIEKHLKVKFDELTPLVLQRYVTELMQSGNIVTEGFSADSVGGIITVIHY